jgi:hypothetical protein
MSTSQTMFAVQTHTMPHAHTSVWTTPRLLRVGLLTTAALGALFALAVWAGIGAHRAAMRTVGVDAAPSIMAAQSLKAEMAGMDADLSNELLGAPGAGGSLNNYDATRGRADELLLQAAENITYGDAEAVPIRSMQYGLGVYEDLAQQARDAHDGASGGDDAATLNVYHQAQSLTDRSLLPAADDLDAANLRELDRTYKRQVEESAASTGVVVLMGLLTLAALVTVQVFLSRRMKRTLNPALLAASLLVLWMTIHASHAMSEAQRQLKVAREDAFASIHSLLRTRATAFEADSLESRYLLDPARAGAAQTAFAARSEALARLQPGVAVTTVIQLEANGYHSDGFTGYLADELKNITFPREREAAVQTLAAWEQYLAVDGRIRALEQTGKHADAVQLASSTQTGGADWAFDEFDRALQATVAINQREFDGAVGRGFAVLDGVETQALVVTAFVLALCFAGLLPRLREYA